MQKPVKELTGASRSPAGSALRVACMFIVIVIINSQSKECSDEAKVVIFTLADGYASLAMQRQMHHS